jgi:hypothetical protein
MSALYNKAKESLLKGEFALDSDVLKALLVDAASYTLDLTTDQFLSDIPGISILKTSQTLTSVTVVAGVFDCDDPVFQAVPATGQGDYIVYYQHTGVAGTSRLLAIATTGTNLPVTPDGSDIEVEVNPAGVFGL